MAGLPLQPVILRYGEVKHTAHADQHVSTGFLATVHAPCQLPSRVLRSPTFCGGVQGSVSPAWESIAAPRHILLMLCHPFHSLTVCKARSACLGNDSIVILFEASLAFVVVAAPSLRGTHIWAMRSYPCTCPARPRRPTLCSLRGT